MSLKNYLKMLLSNSKSLLRLKVNSLREGHFMIMLFPKFQNLFLEEKPPMPNPVHFVCIQLVPSPNALSHSVGLPCECVGPEFRKEILRNP